MLLHELVTRQAERRPAARAVVFGNTSLTYGELEAASNRLAHTLREIGCRAGDRVCFLSPKSPAPIVWMLGILKVGAVHVPLDAASPPARLARIVAACEPHVVLAGGVETSTIEAITPVATRIGWMDERPTPKHAAFDAADVERASPRPISCGTRPDHPAHILFTSGSTGMPKGVVITHANVAAFLQWALPHFGLGEDERVSGHTPLHFDLSTYDVFGAFAAGAELHLVPPASTLLPSHLVDFIRHSRLTQWFSVPSLLNYVAMADALEQRGLPDLRRVLWCGEVFPTPALVYWMQRVPQARFTNLYGPTEATIASSYYDVPECPRSSAKAVPIGRACAGEELLVVDGEVCIAGAGLSPGYWRDPAKTAAAFVAHPHRAGERMYRTGDLGRVRPDGQLELIGRADTQIKSRGYRIELGEIEAGLAALGCLRESAVVAIPSDGFEQWTICCAFTPLDGIDADTPRLRAGLGRLVPAYMLPTRWRRYSGGLPRNANGKVDRPRLKEDFTCETPSRRNDPISLAS